MITAAVALVEVQRYVLCVYNRKLEGFTLPGGKVEIGEAAVNAVKRELFEETGLQTARAELVYYGKAIGGEATNLVKVFRVMAVYPSSAREVEYGRPIVWLTRDLLIYQSPFGEFYEGLFNTVAEEIIVQ